MSGLRWVVSEDIGRFKRNQVLSTDADIAEYFRTFLNEGADERSTLSDEQILAKIEATPLNGMSHEDAEIFIAQSLEG